jgi:glutamate/tyrosine decarboxylase-like PLP-dependent enzyme
VAIAGPRYFGFINSGALPPALAAHWLSTAWEQHGGFQISSPASTRLEQIARRWIVDLLALPRDCAGSFVTGTTAAHITALAAARDALLMRSGWNAGADGLFGAPPITVIAGGEAHPTLFKALGVVGLGRTRVIRVPVDSQGRMRREHFRSSRSNDRLRSGGERGTRARSIRVARSSSACASLTSPCGCTPMEHSVCGRVAPARAHLADGIELADSWATDAHKWLNTPYDCGIVIVRDGNALENDVDQRRLSAERSEQSVGLHAGGVTEAARRRCVGGASHARSIGTR